MELSSDWGGFGDNRIAKLLVKRIKVDFPEFSVGDSSWEPENGCGIFKLLAQDDMPVGDSLGDVSSEELSCPETAEASPLGSLTDGKVEGSLLGGKEDVSADAESIWL